MKKGVIIFLAVMLLVCIVFAACSAKKTSNENEKTTEATGLVNAANEFGFETEAVTDENGKEVTDKDGNTVTTEVAVEYVQDKKGNYIAQKLDENGEKVTNSKGKPVTVKSTYTDTLEEEKKASEKEEKASEKAEKASTTLNVEEYLTTTESTTATPVTTTKPSKNVEITKQSDTTKFEGKEVVPKTTDTGVEVLFSDTEEKNDLLTITTMLEVPYLYKCSYENSDGVPIEAAAYTAVWMAQLNGETAEVFPASPVVLNLFKYYGQTVVNFKTKCNSVKDSPISYDKSNDTFTINEYPKKKQSVSITKIEDLGNNNFYKITGDVSGAGSIKKVVAIIQKNKLEQKLGFSIKAMQWS